MLGIALCLSYQLGHAADVDAGSLQQQIDRNQTFKLPRPSLPTLPPPITHKPSSGLKVWVQRFELQGNSLVEEQNIRSVLSRYEGRELSFQELEAVVAAVADVFRQTGWTVQAYLPEQDINQGVVRIQIVQARLGKVVMDGDVPAPATPNALNAIIAGHQAVGDYLNGPAIDRALLIANDISGVYINGNLKEGEQEGETDLVLNATQKPRFEGNATFDNTGSRSTGANRWVLSASANSVVASGDQATTQWIETRGSRYARLGWVVPVGTDGWKLGGNVSHLSYQVLEFQDTVAPTGTSDTRGLEANYPLLRSKSRNLYLSLAWDEKHFANYSTGVIKSDYSSRLYTVGLYGNSFDEWGGGGANTASLNFVNGYLNLDGSPNAADIASTTLTAGHFQKIRYAFNRQQVLTSDWSLYGALSGQHSMNAKNLDSSEKFYLGGSSGVRAYPSSEAGGSHGVMANLELRWQVNQNVLLGGFYDIGYVVLYPSKNLQDVTALNQYSLKGGGVSLAWEFSEGMSWKVTMARRTGHNPAANIENGRDLDGSLVNNRIWSSLSVAF
jgi:hemolysin activation/secretion protein